MYKEFREVSRVKAVAACYKDMAARHRARFRNIHIIKVAEVKAADVRRPYINQFIKPDLAFPLPHQRPRAVNKKFRSFVIGKRPSTFA